MDQRELNNFFAARGTKRECPICGYDDQWAPMQDDMDLKLQSADGRGYIEIAAVLCVQCGFLRLHSVDAIRNALGDKTKE